MRGTPARAATTSAHAPAGVDDERGWRCPSTRQPVAVAARGARRGAASAPAAPALQPAHVGLVQCVGVDVGRAPVRAAARTAPGRSVGARASASAGVSDDRRVRLARALGQHRGQRRLAGSSNATQTTSSGRSNGGASQLVG